MGNASLLQHSFLGGEISKFYQGRSDKQDYRSWLNACVNYIPIEAGTLVRRPGLGFAGTTRGGAIGRVIKFDFQEQAPYTVEFTDDFIRFWSGYSLVTNNDAQGVVSISTANPAVVTVTTSPASGKTVMFSGLGASCPLLQNRQFLWTNISGTTGSIADAITGANIDGATLGVGSLAATAQMQTIAEIATPYTGRHWQNLRLIQAEQTAFLLDTTFVPRQLIAAPRGGQFATFSLVSSFFEDGPYLDPIRNSILTASAVTGIVTLTAGLPAWSATQAYTKGDFVVSSSVGYESLQDANVNNTPVSSPTFWQVVGVGAPINSGRGFLSSDIGRLVRLYSEPAAWAVGTTYGVGTVISYNPSGLPGQTTYWQSLTGTNLGNIPGTDIKNWQILAPGGQVPALSGQTVSVTQTTTAGQLTVNPSTPVIWTWGKITAISNVGAISGSLAGSTQIGSMTSGGGLAAAFDGNTIKGFNASALDLGVGGGGSSYVGKNYTGAAAQTIAQAVAYPEDQFGFEWHFDASNGNYATSGRTVTINLRAKASLPASPQDGTILGTTTTPADSLAPITLLSNDIVTTWNYVWLEFIRLNAQPDGPSTPFTRTGVAQVIFYTASAAPGTAVSCEILGPPLLYSGTPINLWRLGVFSDTTGWPTVGTYSDGRLWLAGSIPNRFDASVANGVNGIGNGGTLGSVNFAPTDQYGNVLASSGISYILNAPDTNPIFWMEPELQGIICGTKAGEWLVTAPTAGGISPLNIAARRVTKIGAANIEPRRTEHTTIFVQKFGRKIMEYFADVFSGKFTAPHITEKSKHLTIGNVDEIAYQQELAPIVWARVAGALMGWTYKRDTLMTSQGPTFAAGHRHVLGAGRTVESIAVGPSIDGNLDALTIVTNDPATNVRHVEVLTDILDEDSLLSAASYLDDAITPSSTVTNVASGPFPYGSVTLNGLWHLNGKTVTAWMGGLDCGDYTVSNGSITVGFGNGTLFPAATNRNDQGLFTSTFFSGGVTANGNTMFTGTCPMRVGFTYTSQGQIIRPIAPAESGARTGPAFGKMRRVHQYAAQLEGAQGISFGTDFTANTLLPALFQQLNGTNYTVDLQFTGTHWNTLTEAFTRDGGMLAWQVTRPYIANVVAVGEYLETQDQ